MDTLRDTFTTTLKLHTNRDGIDNLCKWLASTDFYKAPGSTKYHDCFDGGLVTHSLMVWSHLKKLLVTYEDLDISMESATIVALLHDVCKIGCYKKEIRWRKNEKNQWESYEAYRFDEDFKFGGHGSKSVFLLQHFIQLTPDEAVAINCHMGVENGKWEVNDAFRECPLAFLLHTADMMSTIDAFNKPRR